MIGKSRHLSVGPEALSSVLTGFAVLKELEIHKDVSADHIAASLAFVVGLVAIGMTFVRLGYIANIISGYFLTGFVLGVAMLIMAEQLPAMFGIYMKHPHPTSTFETLLNRFRELPNANWKTAILSLSTLGLLIFWKFFIKRVKTAWIKRLPIILIVVVLSIILSVTIGFQEHGIKTLGEFDNSIPSPGAPPLSYARITRLLPDALVIVIVGFIESQTVTRTFGLKNGYFPNADRELFA